MRATSPPGAANPSAPNPLAHPSFTVINEIVEAQLKVAIGRIATAFEQELHKLEDKFESQYRNKIDLLTKDYDRFHSRLQTTEQLLRLSKEKQILDTLAVFDKKFEVLEDDLHSLTKVPVRTQVEEAFRAKGADLKEEVYEFLDQAIRSQKADLLELDMRFKAFNTWFKETITPEIAMLHNELEKECRVRENADESLLSVLQKYAKVMHRHFQVRPFDREEVFPPFLDFALYPGGGGNTLVGGFSGAAGGKADVEEMGVAGGGGRGGGAGMKLLSREGQHFMEKTHPAVGRHSQLSPTHGSHDRTKSRVSQQADVTSLLKVQREVRKADRLENAATSMGAGKMSPEVSASAPAAAVVTSDSPPPPAPARTRTYLENQIVAARRVGSPQPASGSASESRPSSAVRPAAPIPKSKGAGIKRPSASGTGFGLPRELLNLSAVMGAGVEMQNNTPNDNDAEPGAGGPDDFKSPVLSPEQHTNTSRTTRENNNANGNRDENDKARNRSPPARSASKFNEKTIIPAAARASSSSTIGPGAKGGGTPASGPPGLKAARLSAQVREIAKQDTLSYDAILKSSKLRSEGILEASIADANRSSSSTSTSRATAKPARVKEKPKARTLTSEVGGEEEDEAF